MQPQLSSPTPGRRPEPNPARPPRPAFLTVEEVADVLRVDAVTIYRAIRAGEFPAVKIRKRYVIPRRAIDMLVEDVMASGSCVDIAEWTASWRQTLGAPVEVPTWAR